MEIYLHFSKIHARWKEKSRHRFDNKKSLGRQKNFIQSDKEISIKRPFLFHRLCVSEFYPSLWEKERIDV